MSISMLPRYIPTSVEYYKNLLLENPAVFLKVVAENQLIEALKIDLCYLTDKISKLILAANEDDQPSLLAKLVVAMGLKDRERDRMYYSFPHSEDPEVERSNARKKSELYKMYQESIRVEEEAELTLIENNPFRNGDKRQLLFSSDFSAVVDPFQSDDILHFYVSRDFSAGINSDAFQQLSSVCLLMKLHKRIITLILETPTFSTALNLVNPNQHQTTSNHTSTVGSHEPSADNNSNDSN